MSESQSEIEEISDTLKEKVLLSILRDKFHQDVGDEVETRKDTKAPDKGEEADTQGELGDQSTALSGSRATARPQVQDACQTQDQEHHQEPQAPARNEPDRIVDEQTIGSRNEQTTEPDDAETAGSVHQATLGPQKDEGKPDPIKENEERLAVEESSLSPDQLKERHEKSQSLRALANNLYKDSAFHDAAVKYSEALRICPLSEEKDRSILHANRAAALMAAHQNREALPDLDRALELDPNYLKSLERRARLNRMLENLDDSLKDYEKLLELRPKHYAYIATIRELQEQIKKRDEELRAKMLDSLKQLGNVFLKPFGLSTENFSMVPSEGGGYSLQMKGQK